MRLLIVGHTYLVAENQKKLWALAAQPGVDVALITPHRWTDPLVGALRPHVPGRAPFAVRPVRAIWPGAEQFYCYLALDLGMRRHPPDILYVEQGAGALVYAQSLVCRRLFAPGARAVFFTWWNLPYRGRWPLPALERFNLRRSQGAVAGSTAAAAILRDHGFSGPLTVLPQLGVDPVEYRRQDATALRQRLGLDRFTVGYAGRLVEEKGLRILLAALTDAPFDFQLLLLGRGPLDAEIRAYAAARGWGERVKIVTGLAHDAMAAHLGCMDVLVLPSLTRPWWREQFGHVLVEGMACEIPVIGSDSGEVPTVIGPAGLVTPEGDVDALRSALSRVAASADLRHQLAAAGRRRVLEHYTHDRLARRLVEFFRSLP